MFSKKSTITKKYLGIREREVMSVYDSLSLLIHSPENGEQIRLRPNKIDRLILMDVPSGSKGRTLFDGDLVALQLVF